MCSKVTQLYIPIHVLFQSLFHDTLLQGTEYSSLCCTVSACCLSVLCIVVCVCSSRTPGVSHRTPLPSLVYSSLCTLIPNARRIPPHPATLFGKHKFVFCLWLCFVNMFICAVFFNSMYKWYHTIFAFLCPMYLIRSSLGPSVLPQMALFHSFYGWVIFQYAYIPHLLYPFTCQWALTLLCLGYYK